MGKSFQIIFSKSLGLSQNTKQGVSAVSMNALFFRCGYSPDLFAALQANPGQSTLFFRKCSYAYSSSKNCMEEIDRLFKRLYENNISGKINDSRFEKLSVDYEMSKQNCRRASLPKCSLMHQKAEQRDFRHAVLSKAINLSYAPLPSRSFFLRRGCFYS